jgi:formylglycine-generating enzyme required for sulfatase activity
VGVQPAVTLADPCLTYTDRVLRYTPGTNESYGDYGQRVNVRLDVADTLGNRASGLAAKFELEPRTTLVDRIRLIGTPGGMAGLQGPDPAGRTLLSVSGNLYTYRFSGATSGLVVGGYIVDASYPGGYMLLAQGVIEDAVNHTAVVLGRPASLAELVADTGSVRFTGLHERAPGAGLQSGGETVELSLPVEFDLSGMVLFEDAPSGFKVRIAEGLVRLTPALEVGAKFKGSRPEEIQAELSGTVYAKAVVAANGSIGKRWTGTKPLMKPCHYFKGAMIGWVPVWVEAVVSLEFGYDAELTASGFAQAGIELTEKFGYQVRYAGNRWTKGPTRFEDVRWPAPDWQIEGDFRIRGSVDPKVEVYIYSLVGAEAGLSPYLELEGDWRLNPAQVSWDLYWGIPGRIAISARVWEESWGELPAWEFDLVPRTLLWHDGFAGPTIQRQPAGVAVTVGQSVTFSVAASGEGLRYQWQKDGANLADGGRVGGSGSPVLRIAGAQPEDAGVYRALVNNRGGRVVSAEAILSVSGGGGPGMVLIPAGTFQMGDAFGEGWSDERPVHTVSVSGFYMDRTEVTKALWDEVYSWAIGHGYGFDNAGSGKAASHPVQTINWYDAVKWCNARSQREGRTPAYYADTALTVLYKTGRVPTPYVRWERGYRLSTEAEWEYAARGGLNGPRFPWGDTISHSQANYYSESVWSYDVSPTRGYHLTHAVGGSPYTSPVGSFGATGFGLYDMAGNVWEWCWDWFGSHGTGAQTNPRGPASGSYRVIRGGSWLSNAIYCRAAYRNFYGPDDWIYNLGFRSVLPPGQP